MLIFLLDLVCKPIALDGDTVRCGREHIRLLAIDAPEMPGHCRRGRVCVVGDPYRSKAHLTAALQGRRLEIDRKGKDRYGRTLATISVDGRDVSCAQLAAGAAVYVRKWDNGGAVRKACPDLAN